MRIKDLSTLIGAGLLSLAAVMILQNGNASKNSTESIASAAEIELSLPVPTAEPPIVAEEPVVEETSLADATPPPLTPTLADAPVPDATTADTGVSPLAANETTIAPPAVAAGGNLSESFMKAVSDATVEESNAAVVAQPSVIEETPDGFWLKSAKLNDVFQHLAQLGNFQYFHNTEIEGPDFIVTGQLMNDDPVRQMEELSLMYGITIHRKGNTIYALTSSQLSRLPTEPFRYQLKYLRPKDIAQIKLILTPFLTPGSGIIEYETKTNTLIVMDNARKLDALGLFLSQIDQPKQQVAIETRILRVTSDSANRIGVDWSSVLGKNGTSISSISSLNALFNLPDIATVASFVTATDDGNSLTNHSSFTNVPDGGQFRNLGDQGGSGGLVLSPVQLTAVLRALNEGNLAQQESSPTLIAEDNEEGLISIIDRIPIVTSTVTITDGSSNITEEVRYKIDSDDATGDPNTTREVGVSVSVTPTILPDSTIRMALRPRSAQVTEYITTPAGNLYPRVNESTVTTTARVPNGHSLLIGGFYEEVQRDVSNKVPILGDLPAVNLLFKTSAKEKKNTSLVFIITPKLYRPEIGSENDITSHEIHESHILPSNHANPDPYHPGSNYRPNLRTALNDAFKKKNKPEPPSNILHPDHPYNRPEALPVHGKEYDDEPSFVAAGERPEVQVRPAGKRNAGLFRMFGGNKKNQVP